jgi:AraC-like DNA-binding protein
MIEWCSDQLDVSDKTAAWECILSQSYRDWQVTRRVPSGFYAHVRQHKFAGTSLVNTICDPCTGRRTIDQVRLDKEIYVAVQLTENGRERFKIADQSMDVFAGDLIVWTSEKVAEFEVLERMHKVTLMVPWSLMKDRFPEHKQLPSGGKIDNRSGVGFLLAVHLRALANEIADLDQNVKGSVGRSTLELLSVALHGQQSTSVCKRSVEKLRRVYDFISRHLHEDDLSPVRVAESNQISLRHLHLLFQQTDTTVSEYILHKRLYACKQALTDPVCQGMQVSEIAYRWGFNSISHFCRTFKARYGASPSQIRRQIKLPG